MAESMITTSTWIPRGFAAPFPSRYNFDEADFERMTELAKLKLDDANDDLEEAQRGGGDDENNGDENEDEDEDEDEDSITGVDDDAVVGERKDQTPNKKQKAEEIDINDPDLKEYDLEHYDDEDEDDVHGQRMDMFGNIKSLAYYESNKEDPYITIPDEQDQQDEDREELQILATDNLLLAAKVEDELAYLEVFVYEDDADNLYVHHDIMLPAIPLCLEWLDVPVSKVGVGKDATANFVAIGTMDPDIEVWDLDTVDSICPNAILGQGGNLQEQDRKKKKKKKKSKKANDEYHVDAVLSLAANRKHRNLLASASADKTVKLWDLNTAKCAKSYSYHTDKVCSLAWHAVESTVLLSGSYDRTVVAADMRAPDAKTPRWGVESDVENIKWDPHDPNFFYVSTENGIIHYFDIRNIPSSPSASKAVWTLQAHDESLTSFDINAHVPGFIATGSTDKTVKLWNIQPSGPAMVVSRNLDIGRVFSTNFAPDPEVAFRLAVAGSKGTMHVWDTSTNAAVRKAFAHKLAVKPTDDIEERLVSVANAESSEDGSDDEDDEEESGDSMDED